MLGCLDSVMDSSPSDNDGEGTDVNTALVKAKKKKAPKGRDLNVASPAGGFVMDRKVLGRMKDPLDLGMDASVVNSAVNTYKHVKEISNNGNSGVSMINIKVNNEPLEMNNEKGVLISFPSTSTT